MPKDIFCRKTLAENNKQLQIKKQFLFESTKINNASFPYKTMIMPYQKPLLKQIEWGV